MVQAEQSFGGVMRSEELSQLFLTEIPSLRRYARMLVGNADHADDLVQECLTRAIAKLEQRRYVNSFRSWLFSILHNAFVDEVRRGRRAPATNGYSDLDDPILGSRADGDRVAFSHLVETFNKLPEDMKSVILLVGVEGFEYAEAAQILEIPVGTVRSRLSRARNTLRLLLTQDAGHSVED